MQAIADKVGDAKRGDVRARVMSFVRFICMVILQAVAMMPVDEFLKHKEDDHAKDDKQCSRWLKAELFDVFSKKMDERIAKQCAGREAHKQEQDTMEK